MRIKVKKPYSNLLKELRKNGEIYINDKRDMSYLSKINKRVNAFFIGYSKEKGVAIVKLLKDFKEANNRGSMKPNHYDWFDFLPLILFGAFAGLVELFLYLSYIPLILL